MLDDLVYGNILENFFKANVNNTSAYMDECKSKLSKSPDILLRGS